jgi:hypothetical protein
MTTPLEFGGSTPLLRSKPYPACRDWHDQPVAIVVAQQAAPVRSALPFNFQLSTVD